MITTSSPTTAIDQAKIEHSRAAIGDFLEYQEEWLARAEAAHKAGYPIEVIGICLNQIHGLLRRGLWLKAQQQSLEQYPHLWRDEYLFDLLQEVNHDLMEQSKDGELYHAAQRFDVIDENTATRLHMLNNHCFALMRRTFTKRHDVSDDLALLAGECLERDRICLEELKKDFAVFDTAITTLLRTLQKE